MRRRSGREFATDSSSIGVKLNEAENEAGAPVISSDGGPATVRMIRTDEERVIAENVLPA